MSDEEEPPVEESAPRSRRMGRQQQEKSSRQSALEKLRQCKAEGKKRVFEVGEVENVYEEVTEEEYSSRVQSRIEANFVVGDGYDDDGREIFDEEYDYDSDQEVKGKSSKASKKRKGGAAGGKEEQQSRKKMKCIDDVFRSINTKKGHKDESVKLADDQLLGDLLKNIGEEEDVELKPVPMKHAQAKMQMEDSGVKTSFSGAAAANNPFMISKNKPLNKFATNKPSTSRLATSSTEPELAAESAPMKAEPVIQSNESNDLADDFEDFDFDDNFHDEQDSPVKTEQKTAPKAEPKPVVEDDWDDGIDWSSELGGFESNAAKAQSAEATGQKKSVNFYWLDAFEDPYKNPDCIFLFGKVYDESTKKFKSCCVRVMNLDRIIYLLPRTYKKSNPMLLVAIKDLYAEFDAIAGREKILKFKSRVVKKEYCFEISDVPVESDYLEVRYSAKLPELKQTEGDTFCKVFGVKTSILENFLLLNKIYGPCWLQLSCTSQPGDNISWCDMNLICDGCNSVKVIEKSIPSPSVTAISLSTRVAFNSAHNQNEIVGVGILINRHVSLSNPIVPSGPGKQLWQEHVFCIAKPRDTIFPYSFDQSVKGKIRHVSILPNEKALLNWLLAKIRDIDPDIIIGHDLVSFELDLIVSRTMFHRVANWSRISRLKRAQPPKSFNGMVPSSLTAGRLICDITISAKELIRCRGYALADLSLQILQEQREVIEPVEVANCYTSNDALLNLIALTLTDCSYCLRIANELQSIPLAIQITEIAGNVASRTFSGGRAERNEFLLLHAFYEKGFICPDKQLKKQAQQHFIDNHDQENEETQPNEAGGKKKKAAYAGGLVLDPKKGFYNNCILLLDFNSLYPSIIQEYNICYTTVDRAKCYLTLETDEPILPEIPDAGVTFGVLPTEIRKLVDKRKQVKQLLKTPDLSLTLKAQYDIRQKALKLTANSMYGCLGFPNSRFYAKPLAALITAKGREILVKTKQLVETMGYDVIYGDTDSIMVNTCLDNMQEVFKIGNKIKNEVNKFYRLLEIDIDGVYKTLLLLKKKKYAALAVTPLPNNQFKYEKELKGLDIVRRDWSILARSAGEYVIGEILSSAARDDIICNIQMYLGDLAKKMDNGEVPLEQYIIRKTLNKPPEAYPDKKSLPHVQVAFRLNSKGGKKKLQGGDTVPYVVCLDDTELAASQRGYSPEEVEKSGGKLVPDKKYYLSQQLHPVISRLLEPIEEISSAGIAQCLGLDPTQYANKETSTNITDNDEADLETRFALCRPFAFNCGSCKNQVFVKHAFNDAHDKLALDQCEKCNSKFTEQRARIINTLTSSLRQLLLEYYNVTYKCDDCDFTTRSIPFLFAAGGKLPLCPQCKKHAINQGMSGSELYNQLSFFSYCFDPHRAITTMPEDARVKANMAMRGAAQTKVLYSNLKENVEDLLAKSAFSTVNMSNLFRPLTRTHNFGGF